MQLNTPDMGVDDAAHGVTYPPILAVDDARIGMTNIKEILNINRENSFQLNSHPTDIEGRASACGFGNETPPPRAPWEKGYVDKDFKRAKELVDNLCDEDRDKIMKQAMEQMAEIMGVGQECP